MSIRWIRNVLVEDKKMTLEILLGANEISDKCYVRINGGKEYWFNSNGDSREQIILQGILLLKDKLGESKVTTPDGSIFTWH